jgi:uncharacterized protein (TIGR02145 family)
MKTSRFVLLILFFLVSFYSCQKIEKITGKVKIPTVTTSPVTEYDWEVAKANGIVVNDGGAPIQQRGICVTLDAGVFADIYNTPQTTTSRKWTVNCDSSGLGNFSCKINIQWPGAAHSILAVHYIKAYAVNKAGVAYGEVVSFTPKSKPPTAPAISLINYTTSTISIKINIQNIVGTGIDVDETGLCWGIMPKPVFEDLHLKSDLVPSSGGLLFTGNIQNLLPNTKYFIRGYLKNESGIAYSEEISITTWKGQVTDASNNIYQVITIGTQDWIASNLATLKFSDGTAIPVVTDNLQWPSLTTSASCDYNGQSSNGKLYNYYSAVDSRKLCPTGWHVPADNEWKTLEMNLGMSQSQADATGSRGTDEGGKLKSTDIGTYWIYSNTGATNASGFSAYGAGYRYDNGIFSSYGLSGNFWTSTESDAGNAWCRYLTNTSAQISRISLSKKFGMSVRCVKD